jgi:hypothetical protein
MSQIDIFAFLIQALIIIITSRIFCKILSIFSSQSHNANISFSSLFLFSFKNHKILVILFVVSSLKAFCSIFTQNSSQNKSINLVLCKIAHEASTTFPIVLFTTSFGVLLSFSKSLKLKSLSIAEYILSRSSGFNTLLLLSKFSK